MKTCVRCEKAKPTKDFWEGGKRPDRITDKCTECKQWVRDNPVHPRKTEEQRIAFNTYMRGYLKERQGVIRAYKNGRGCDRCGEADARCLQFHHRDPSEKTFTIGKNGWQKPLEVLWDEVTKCDVLCANCHIKSHVG